MKHNVLEIVESNGFKIDSSNNIALINFWADFHEPCKHFNTVFEELSRKFPKLIYYKVNAEDSELAEKYDIESVPTFVFLKNDKVIEKYEGSQIPALNALVQKYSQDTVNVAPAMTKTDNLDQKLERLINSQPVMLFMKGKIMLKRQSIYS